MSLNSNLYPEVVLKEEKDGTIYFKVLSKEETIKIREGLVRYAQHSNRTAISLKQLELNTELQLMYPFSYSNIIAIGDTDLPHGMAAKLIDSVYIHTNDYTGHSYKCFQNRNWTIQHTLCNFAVHVDSLASWNCLMEYCHNPEYGVIYKIPR
jgi:hypothetical protein